LSLESKMLTIRGHFAVGVQNFPYGGGRWRSQTVEKSDDGGRSEGRQSGTLKNFSTRTVPKRDGKRRTEGRGSRC